MFSELQNSYRGFGQRSTNSHEISLSLLVLVRAISWIVFWKMREYLLPFLLSSLLNSKSEILLWTSVLTSVSIVQIRSSSRCTPEQNVALNEPGGSNVVSSHLPARPFSKETHASTLRFFHPVDSLLQYPERAGKSNLHQLIFDGESIGKYQR